MSSAIIAQLKEYQEAAKVSSEFSDLVSVETLSVMTHKSIRQVKDILRAEGLEPKAQFGKSYLYSKSELLRAIKKTA